MMDIFRKIVKTQKHSLKSPCNGRLAFYISTKICTKIFLNNQSTKRGWTEANRSKSSPCLKKSSFLIAIAFIIKSSSKQNQFFWRAFILVDFSKIARKILEVEKKMVPKILFKMATDFHDRITCHDFKNYYLEVSKLFLGLLRMKINGKQNLKKYEKSLSRERFGDAFGIIGL